MDPITVAAAQPRSFEEAVDLTFEVVRYSLGLTFVIAVVYVVCNALPRVVCSRSDVDVCRTDSAP